MADYSTEQNFRLAQKMLEQQGEINALKAERDALKAAIERVRLEIAKLAASDTVGVIRQVVVDRLTAALDTPSAPESPEKPCHIGGQANAEDCPACSGTNPPYPFICPGEPESEDHVDRHGRSWDPHPFVQSRAVDNVGVCICGLSPDHPIHHRAPESPESEEGSDGA